MPAALTIHDIDDELYAAIRAKADEMGTSMNRAIKATLASALGLFRSRRKNYASDFSALANSISHDEALFMREELANCRKIDSEEWS